jgi:hypothetical protein
MGPCALHIFLGVGFDFILPGASFFRRKDWILDSFSLAPAKTEEIDSPDGRSLKIPQDSGRNH